jgi:probable F420-dependent oxidoreductase
MVGLGFAAARAPRLKLGMHLIVPGKNPLGLARAMAELDQLSGGRLLTTAVLGLDLPAERAAQGRPSGDRGRELEAVLAVLRRLWAGETVTEEVAGTSLIEACLPVRPRQDPLEVWLGGGSDAALRRVGRIGDGWLPGVVGLDAAVAQRKVIDEEAARCGREISREHFGMNVSYAWDAVPPDVLAGVAARAKGADPAWLVPVGRAALRDRLEAWVDAGFTKFVVRPAAPPRDWTAELERLADAVLDLQT